jgi:adenine-specific DNA methylase
MIPKECKRLAEVDFPIAIVSKHSAREKSIRHGHPSTLHLWWARRPLAACRAMLMALLLPDPNDTYCPEQFKQRARNILPRVQGKPGATDSDLRNELLRFIGDFANWDNSASPVFLEAARGLVKAAYGDEPPLVTDPFSGGGSIPLEALRVGCDAFGSDLNPVACLILNTLLTEIPLRGMQLADELHSTGKRIKAAAEKQLVELYPSDPDGSQPIAYLWTRTIICDSCGAEMPLMRSFWLSKKPHRKRALRHSVVRPKSGPPRVEFEVFAPKNDSEVHHGTVSRAKASCLCCGTVLPPERVRVQLSRQQGGASVEFDKNGRRVGGAFLLAVVTLNNALAGRQYRISTNQDYQAVYKSTLKLSVLTERTATAIPHEVLPFMSGTFNVPLYGMQRWGDLFSTRQKVALMTFVDAIRSQQSNGITKQLLALTLSHVLDRSSSLCRWRPEPYMETVESIYGRQALPMVWDFAEAVLTTESTGSFDHALEVVTQCVRDACASVEIRGNVQIADACSSPLPDDEAAVWFTDPPYYFAVPYADLSDYFFVWLKRVLAGHPLLRDPFDAKNPLTPKEQELCEMQHWDPARYGNKDKAFFESGMSRAFAEGRRVLKADGIGCVVFAHKTTDGWEALLAGMISAGWVISSSWPVTTEMPNRLRARKSAALAASVHLVCRPRDESAPVGDWANVLRELPERVGLWIERLQEEGIRGADLVFACIGPAMEVYSRYRGVEDAEGREIPLGGDPSASEPYRRGFLAYVWETVGRLALEQVLGTAEASARNGAAGALEEDSRLTALFLWTLQSTEVKDGDAVQVAAEDNPSDEGDDEEESSNKKKEGYTLIFDVARRFAQPLGIHLDKWEGRIVETDKGIVRLLPVAERATQLFGDADAAAMARRIEQDVKAQRNYTFAFMQDAGAAPQIKTGAKGRKSKEGAAEKTEPSAPQQVTTLDRVHAAMLLQSSGQTNGLRALLREEQQRGPDFVRLANALSALYPKDSEEKRLLDAMLLAVPRN